MEGRKSELLQRIESDREVLLDFLRCFIRCQSPNPPGDTREAADPTASVFTFLYLRELRGELHGRLTLSAVSDEETFGPYGARYLAEHHPEVFGDTCLNGEPSSPWTLRFGEKGPLWLEFTVRTKGAHGAYTDLRRFLDTSVSYLRPR